MAKKNTIPNSTKTTHFRKADSGEYTTKEYAQQHPKTTVKETDKKKK